MEGLSKYNGVGQLELLAAYIKKEVDCSDEEAWDAAYDLFDSLDRMIEYRMLGDEDEE